MLDANRHILVAADADGDIILRADMANRHGCITGATGTGKTVTLQTLAEGFSAMGVPVLVADIKGDLSGLGAAGLPKGKPAERVTHMRLTDKGHAYQAFPVCFWDVFGQAGHPLRATASDMGPLLFSRLLHLNDIQNGVMTLMFRVADDAGLLLLDMKDIRSMAQFVGENRAQFTASYGNISLASVGAIQRGLLHLEEQGGAQFLGEPALDIFDLLQQDTDGRGIINILAADRLMQSPRLYATVLLWLLSELYEQLPEAGDMDKPRLVLFFDEAHLLFDDAAPALLEKIEQVTRLIRSKGVGVYFVTQHPTDIPDKVLGQLGNRIQHALRAFTPRDQKNVHAAAQTFRPNPALDIERAITEVGVGEAIVSCLDAKGAPQMARRGLIVPPQSHIGPIDNNARTAIMRASLVSGHYEQAVDRESAYEQLTQRNAATAQQQQAARALKEQAKAQKEAERDAREAERAAARARREDPVQNVLSSLAKQTVRSITSSVGREIGRQILRGVLGGIFGGRR